VNRVSSPNACPQYLSTTMGSRPIAHHHQPPAVQYLRLRIMWMAVQTLPGYTHSVRAPYLVQVIREMASVPLRPCLHPSNSLENQAQNGSALSPRHSLLILPHRAPRFQTARQQMAHHCHQSLARLHPECKVRLLGALHPYPAVSPPYLRVCEAVASRATMDL
jgi:hypothetical protein